MAKKNNQSQNQKQQNKKLPMNKIKNQNKIYNKYVELPVDIEDETYTVKIYPYFKPEKVSKLIESLVSFYKKADEENVDIELKDYNGLIGYYVIRYFTDIIFTQSKKAKTIYAEYQEAKNSHIFEVILESIPESSMEYVYDQLAKFQEFNDRLKEQFNDFTQDLQEMDVDNEEVEHRFKPE